MSGRLKNLIGGEWTESTAKESLPLASPATGESLGSVPLSTAEDVDRAVRAAKNAFTSWRRVSPVQRARFLFKYKQVLEDNFEAISRIVTEEHGKTLPESRGSVRRGIENVEHACGIPTLMMGESLEDIATGIDCETVRQPLGVFAAIAPFNFPAMVPMWFWPYAVATGNTVVIKPSEQVPNSQRKLFELAQEAGFPAGVLNLVHGGKEVVESFCSHPDIRGVSFVGSTPIAKLVYARATSAGKRVQALGGAKNHIIVTSYADLEKTAPILAESCFGCAGQRCLAGSTVVGVGDVYDRLRDRVVAETKKIRLGNGLLDGVDMGPVVSTKAKERILAALAKAESQGAKILLDGRGATVKGLERGHWLGPTVIEGVTDAMDVAREEVFGPVMVIRRAKDLDEAIALVHKSEYANACSIFTQNGAEARKFRYEVGVSMLGVNIGVAAPMAFFPFGGAKQSFFGDLKAHGKDSIQFFTDAKVVISRWF